MEEITIKIYINSEGEYNYDVYDTNDVDDDTESVDGGVCTGTLLDTIDMAKSAVEDLQKSKE